MYSQLTVAKLFDLSQTQAETLLNRFQYPWEALPHIKEFIPVSYTHLTLPTNSRV